MGKEHSWLNYTRNAEIIEITIKDFSNSRIESFKCNVDDKVKAASIMKILREKYGFSPIISNEESINEKDKDIDWLKNAEW